MAVVTRTPHTPSPPKELTDPPAPLRFDRRASERHPAIGTLEAMQCDGMKAPVVMQLHLLDESAGGLAALADAPLAPGARLRVRTCPVKGVWCDGRVVRCAPAGQGYRVALSFERRRAA